MSSSTANSRDDTKAQAAAPLSEVSLRSSLTMLQQVVDHLPQAIGWKDTNAVFLGCNQAFARSVGLHHPMEIVGRAASDVQWQKYPAAFLHDRDRALIEQQQAEYHQLQELPDAESPGWLEISRIPLCDEYGLCTGILTIIDDATDRKQAEETLRQSEATNRALINAVPDLLFRIRQDETYLDVQSSKSFKVLNPDQLMIGTKVSNSLPFDLAQQRMYYVQKALSTGDLQIYEQELVIDGDTKYEEVRIVPCQANEVMAMVRDITDRKQAEAALRESEQQMREQAHRERLINRLVSRIRDSLDFDTILETTLQEVQNFTNADRCQFTWYDPNQEESYWEVVKETRFDHLPDLVDRYPVSPASPLLTQLLDLQILRVEDVETLSESSLLRFMQRFGYKAMLAIPMRMQSGLLGTIFCCNSIQPQVWSESAIDLIQAVIAQLAIALTQADLYTQSRTKAKALEQALRELKATQTQMVQGEKMSSLGQLVAGVAHEINNPVNFIYGNLSHATRYTQDLLHLVRLYQQHYTSPVAPIQAAVQAIDLDFLLEDLPKLMASMRVGADRIQKIVLALRNFSRMDEAEVKQVNIHEGIDSTLMILQSRLKGKAGQTGIDVMKDYGQLPAVECYPGQLNQVFMNILSNAIDALEESSGDDRPPKIRIQTEHVNSESIVIRIADNGCGMTQDQQKRLFDPFFTTKPIGKGTGLGLSISYQIVVQKHGGMLTCFSVQGEGTEFYIEIPIKPAS